MVGSGYATAVITCLHMCVTQLLPFRSGLESRWSGVRGLRVPTTAAPHTPARAAPYNRGSGGLWGSMGSQVRPSAGRCSPTAELAFLCAEGLFRPVASGLSRTFQSPPSARLRNDHAALHAAYHTCSQSATPRSQADRLLSSIHLLSPCARCRQDDPYLECSEAVAAGVAAAAAAAGGAWGVNISSSSASEDERNASVGCTV